MDRYGSRNTDGARWYNDACDWLRYQLNDIAY
jgi:hypothetical protein